MSWITVNTMDQRIRFISEYKTQLFNFSSLCRQFSISRKTGYKWVKRYVTRGIEALKNQSKAPKHIPHKTDKKVQELLIHFKKRFPAWGPKKAIIRLKRKHPELQFPAPSTVADIFRREGLSERRRRRVKRMHPGCPAASATHCNEIWTADYKGEFKTINGEYCYPLTICDMYSRKILGIDAHAAISMDGTRAFFEKMFIKYGLPERIRTDNGIPFASTAIARLSRLSAWWIRLGVYPELIEPGNPQQNGTHERMHRDLKKECTIPPAYDLCAQQKIFNQFVKRFNNVRPHEALHGNTPGSVYALSVRKYYKHPPQYQYPAQFILRRVSNNGAIRFLNKSVPVSQTLIQEIIGFEEIDENVYNVYYYDVLLGRFDLEKNRIIDIMERVSAVSRRQKFL
ncbi:MAG: transposase [Spirochaetes bacterium]|nr:transposase [Spirochaetota bacterium]